jgi:hypothetical protein
LNRWRDRNGGVRVGIAAAPQGNATDDGDTRAADKHAHHELARRDESAALGPTVQIVVSLDLHRDACAYVIALLEKFGLESVKLTIRSDYATLAGSDCVRGKRAAVGLGGHLIALHGQFGTSLERT